MTACSHIYGLAGKPLVSGIGRDASAFGRQLTSVDDVKPPRLMGTRSWRAGDEAKAVAVAVAVARVVGAARVPDAGPTVPADRYCSEVCAARQFTI
jgi:hypothetical protein